MRWLTAGLAFALMVGLAVFTTAIKSRNLAMRARIEEHVRQIIVLRVEDAWRQEAIGGEAVLGDLQSRLRDLLLEARGRATVE